VIRGLVVAFLIAGFGVGAHANDWPYWRGPEQTGMTREPAPVTRWSQAGENLLWRTPIGGRSTPVIMDGRLFAIVPDPDTLAERVVCLDAVTGRLVWEYGFPVYHTDIVEARLGWTAVAGDPETGNVYAHGTGGELFCFSRDGDVVWKRSLSETFGRYSGYGGRLHTPIVDEDRVIISLVYILSSWNTGPKKSGHRYIAFNKHTGEVEWWAQPGVKPLDTTYSVPVVTVIDGRRLLVAANADGNVYGMLARTGERVWSFTLSKRGINSSVVVDGDYAYVIHSEENHETTEMGSVVCLDASKTGNLNEGGVVWRHDGITAGYSSPAIARGRLYVVTNNADLLCFNARTGEKVWEHKLGRVMKGSPAVTADGIIYAGEVNGRFLIVKDAGDHAETLDEEEFAGRDSAVVEFNGSPAVADGRVYFMTSYEMFCLGPKQRPDSVEVPIPRMGDERAVNPEKPGALQIVPMDTTLSPGDQRTFIARLFDDNGRVIGAPEAKWSAEGPAGAFTKPGVFTAATDNRFSAGVIRAQASGLTAEARVRVSPTLPIHENFDAMATGTQPPGWIGVDLTTEIAERDGTHVLHKKAESPSAPYCRMQAFSGPPIPVGYTVQADLMAEPRQQGRPVLSDMGLINGRWKLILLAHEQKLRLVSYEPIPRVQVDVPFEWSGERWYRANLRVEVVPSGNRALAKVWPRDQEEPEEWTADLVAPTPHREGSPGLYAYSKGTRPGRPGSSVFFDNYQVTDNE